MLTETNLYHHEFSFDADKADDIEYIINTLEQKYFDLVWAARKPHPEDIEGLKEYFNETPDSIILGSRMGVLKVHQKYPDEMERLSCPESGDWEHGFNSGILAAMRFLQTAMHTQVCDRNCVCDSEEPCILGGLQEAIDEFPFLDT